jgi:hypothetical protein
VKVPPTAATPMMPVGFSVLIAVMKSSSAAWSCA